MSIGKRKRKTPNVLICLLCFILVIVPTNFISISSSVVQASTSVVTPFNGELKDTNTFKRPKLGGDITESCEDYDKLWTRSDVVTKNSTNYNLWVSTSAPDNNWLMSDDFSFFTRNLVPSVTGQYTISVDSGKTNLPAYDDNSEPNDTIMFLYKDSFDPTNPTANLQYAHDTFNLGSDCNGLDWWSRISDVELTADTTYVMVVSSFSPAITGSVYFNITGPGAVTVSANENSSDVTIQDSIINPTTGTFDKNEANQSDVVVTMTLNGNTLTSIANGGSTLTEGTDYTVNENTVTIKKEYLATQIVGSTNLTFTFSAGNPQNLGITVSDTTPQNSTISPTSGTFDKKAANQSDVVITMTLNGNTLTSIANGGNTIAAGTEYTVSGDSVTIKKEYLATQAVGSTNLTFTFSAGNPQNLGITVSDSTPQTSTISPTSGTFDKKVANQSDVAVTMTLNGNTLTSIANGGNTLAAGTDYTVSGDSVTIKKEYLAIQAVGSTNLTFTFSAGNPQNLGIIVSDTTPQISTISPTSRTFDKKVANQSDVVVTMTLNGNTLTSIANGGSTLTEGTDYTVSENSVTIKKEYLATQAVGSMNLTFTFSAGNPQNLGITVSDTTPTYTVIYNENGSTGGEVPLESNYYKEGTIVPVQGNIGNLVKAGYTFANWNTKADGSGTSYAAGATFPMGSGNVTLYAKWNPIPSSDGGSSTPSQPGSQVITVPVETGNVGSGSRVTETLITRTTGQGGNVKDEVTLTPDRARETAQTISQSGQNTARIVVPDQQDSVSQVDINVPRVATRELGNTNVNLEIFTDNVRIIIPQGSMDNFEDDLYFRVIPIKEEPQRRDVENRARVEQIVREVAKDDQVKVISRPMTIETNMQSRPVTLILPLRDVQLPTNASERAIFLNELVIFIEHSDGEKHLAKGKVVEYKDGQIGIEFGVNKFSTFTILHMEGFEGNFHEAYIKGYEDGTFKPTQTVTRAEIAAMIARNLGYDEMKKTSQATFSDVPITHWAAGVIEFSKQEGLMKGDNVGKFNPNASITRAEMAAIVARYKELALSTDSKAFPDIAGHWAAKEIAANKQAGIIGGYQDGTFRPNGNLTRAEAVKVLNSMFDRGPLYGVTTPSFKDVPATHWAFQEVEEAAQNHFFTPRTEGGENIVK